MSIAGKRVLLTGGTRGIGRAVAAMFAADGADICLTYKHSEEQAGDLVAALSGAPGKILARRYDAADPSSARSLAEWAGERLGGIDVLINNAGIRSDRPLLVMKQAEWDDVLCCNLTGVYTLTKVVLPFMMRTKAGRIINISSVSGLTGMAGQTNYSASKAGIIGFTKALAKETARLGISVNAVAPGPVETDMLKGLSKAFVDQLLAQVPIKRLCRAEEVARVVRFLADHEQAPAYLTGQVIALDGGMGL